MTNRRLIKILKLVRKNLYVKKVTGGIRSIMIELLETKKISVNELKEIKFFIFDNIPSPANEYKDFFQIDLGYFWRMPIQKDSLENEIIIKYFTALINNNNKPNRFFSFLTNLFNKKK